MLARPPNLQATIIVVSYTFDLLAAWWIFMDAKARRAEKPLFAALAVLLLGPLWLAFYMADRPLRANEQRTGGFGWTWTRNFAIAWTAAMVPWVVPHAFKVATGASTLLRSVAVFLAMWLAPIAATRLVGYLVRRPDALESGGPAPARAPIPLAAVSALALLTTLAILSALYRRAL